MWLWTQEGEELRVSEKLGFEKKLELELEFEKKFRKILELCSGK